MNQKHYYQGKGTLALLHVEMVEDDKMNIKLNGDPVIVANMIATAMDAKQDICAAMIAAVFSWADQNNIPRNSLQDMIKFYPK